MERTAAATSILWEYWTYSQCPGDSLGQFLTEYWDFWDAAHEHGATGYDGIVRLIPLLPTDWRGWAGQVAVEYMYTEGLANDPIGNLPGFLLRLRNQFEEHGAAPLGPYLRAGDLTVIPEPRKEDEDEQAQDVPNYPLQVFYPAAPAVPVRIPSPHLPGFGLRKSDDFETGSSRLPVGFPSPSPTNSLVQALHSEDSDEPLSQGATERLMRTLRKASREDSRGKAPIEYDSDGGENPPHPPADWSLFLLRPLIKWRSMRPRARSTPRAHHPTIPADRSPFPCRTTHHPVLYHTESGEQVSTFSTPTFVRT